MPANLEPSGCSGRVAAGFDLGGGSGSGVGSPPED